MHTRVWNMRTSRVAFGRRLGLLATLLLLACGLRPVAQAQGTGDAQTPHGDGGEILRLTVTVTGGRGEFVKGLGEKDFSVTAGGRPREVVYARSRDLPASVGLLLDDTASVTNSRLILTPKGVRDAVARFVSLGHESNDYFIASIGTRPELVADWGRAADLDLSRVGSGGMKGLTPFNDALHATLEKLKGGARHRRVVVVVSDGVDNASVRGFPEVVKMLGEGDVLVYAVAVYGDYPGKPSTLHERDGRDRLEELASVTGGKVFYPRDKKEFAAAFDRIAAELRQQYELGVRLGGEVGGRKPLPLKVRVGAPDRRPEQGRISARTRKGFEVKM